MEQGDWVLLVCYELPSLQMIDGKLKIRWQLFLRRLPVEQNSLKVQPVYLCVMSKYQGIAQEANMAGKLCRVRS